MGIEYCLETKEPVSAAVIGKALFTCDLGIAEPMRLAYGICGLDDPGPGNPRLDVGTKTFTMQGSYYWSVRIAESATVEGATGNKFKVKPYFDDPARSDRVIRTVQRALGMEVTRSIVE